MSDIDRLRRRFVKFGWTLVRRSKHGWLYESPTGARIVIPTTPSDHRWRKNLSHDFLRQLDKK